MSFSRITTKALIKCQQTQLNGSGIPPALEGIQQRAFNSYDRSVWMITLKSLNGFHLPFFQLVFTKITNLASTATDVFESREQFATVLLMGLMETIILWLSDDQAFWEEIEQGAKPLGPFGLQQQLYLDMEFVLIFASQGRYFVQKLTPSH
ncbi:Exocyst complex component EXO84A [Linum perenne]